jgi:hypothetical protein
LLNGREADPSLQLARAMLLEAEGDAEAALAAYDALDAVRDRRARALALRRAAELRLATGRHDAGGAAAALERTLSAWRGDAGEGELRLRIAQLQRQAGRPLSAFDGLREAELLLPDLVSRLREEGGTALADALRTEAPFAAVTLFDTHADRLPPGAATDEVLGVLAERLAALDLTERAAVVLRRAAPRAATPEARARHGAREAALALAGRNAAGAQAALQASAAGDLPAPLVQERALLEARALAWLGEGERAAERFRAAGAAGAPELAELLASRRDWAGAAAALRQVLGFGPAAPGTMQDPPRQELIARVAAFLALAGDEAALAGLREAHAAEMAGSPLAEPFALLTGGRVSGMAELARVSRDVELARVLPARLEVLRTGPQAAR